jgi:hypothetical protein
MAAEDALAAIERGALLGIREQVVGLADLLEARLRLGVIGVAVGVVRARKLAIGLLDLSGGGLLVDAEDGVWILARGHHRATYPATSTRAGRTRLPASR